MSERGLLLDSPLLRRTQEPLVYCSGNGRGMKLEAQTRHLVTLIWQQDQTKVPVNGVCASALPSCWRDVSREPLEIR